MLNKEEIEYIEELEKAIEDDKSFYWQEDMYELIEIIKKQNGREQKLIEKLEEDIKEFGNYAERKEMAREQLYENDGKWFYCQEILSILKGE